MLLLLLLLLLALRLLLLLLALLLLALGLLLMLPALALALERRRLLVLKRARVLLLLAHVSHGLAAALLLDVAALHLVHELGEVDGGGAQLVVLAVATAQRGALALVTGRTGAKADGGRWPAGGGLECRGEEGHGGRVGVV